MDFLQPRARKKIIRTTLYGDQEFSKWELEILHTPIVQRLYNLKQLGFTDRVYPDAVHSRFNHILGVAEVVERMAVRVQAWLKENPSVSFRYAVANHDPQETEEINAGALGDLLRERITVVRLMALLHDLTHAAYGHTLEDEVCLFEEKHDNQPRQQRFFDALIAQLLYIWLTELRISDADPEVLDALCGLTFRTQDVFEWSSKIAEKLSPAERKYLATLLRELELAMVLLAHIDFIHQDTSGKQPDRPSLLVDEVARRICDKVEPMTFVVHRDAYLVDMVGNTICADLLDYAKRDAVNAGLKTQFDDRLVRYLAVVSVDHELSPTGMPCIRLAIQFFTDKMRHDVLSEMSAVLKARYLINERVLFHPTKCAAGAMLGTAVQLLGLEHLPHWMQALGDQEFLVQLSHIAESLAAILAIAEKSISKEWTAIRADLRRDSKINEIVQISLGKILDAEQIETVINQLGVDIVRRRITGARKLLWRLSARRFPKLVYRLRAGLQHSGGEGDETLAGEYCQPVVRYELEREIETKCNLPPGSIVVHCPRRKTSMKVAEVLVVGADLTRVAKLRDVTSVSPEDLEPYQTEIRAIENMYRSIWQFHVYLDHTWADKQPVIEWVLEERLAFPNDKLFGQELAAEHASAYALLANELKGEIAPDRLSEIIKRVDQEQDLIRLGNEGNEAELRERLLAIIHDVNAQAAAESAIEHVLTSDDESATDESAEVILTVKLEQELPLPDEDRFIMICKNYLKRDYPKDESRVKNWYRMELPSWTGAQRSVFLSEFEESVSNTPAGEQRRATSERDTPEAKMFAFLDNLVSKHRGR
jgi:HD superfamily phosphohydrolase